VGKRREEEEEEEERGLRQKVLIHREQCKDPQPNYKKLPLS